MIQEMKDYLEDYKKEVEEQAQELCNKTMPEITADLYDIYEKTGDRLTFENVYFERRRFVVILGLASILFHKQRYIKKLSDVLISICNEACWALPAHVDKKNKNWKITVELYATETAQALTEITYLLDHDLDEDVKQLVRTNVNDRVLIPFYESTVPYAWWENSEMNWCAVCAGNIGSIILYRYRDHLDAAQDYLSRIDQALEYYINGFSEDGACMEGLDYWTYGLSYYAMYEESRNEFLHLGAGVFNQNKLKQIMEFQQKCYLCQNATLSFSDGSEKSRFRIGLSLYFASMDANVKLPEFSDALHISDDPCYHWAAIYRDYIWTVKYGDLINQSEDKSKQGFQQYYLPDAQWLICSDKQYGFAVKGGNNDEPHNHNDVGNFLYAYQGTEFITDLGAGEYCKYYFNQNRYSIFCNNAESHNIPVINGRLQPFGKQYRCHSFDAHQMNHNNSICMDLTDAYEKDSIHSFIRNISYADDLRNVEVVDTFTIDQNTTSIVENLVTRLHVDITEQGFRITDQMGNECKIQIMTPVVSKSIEYRLHNNHEGKQETISLLRWNIPLNQVMNSNSEIKVTFFLSCCTTDEKEV